MSADTPEIERGKRAYSVQSMSEAYEVSVSGLRNEIAERKLHPKYYGRKPLIHIEEADRWFDSLGDERPGI